MPRTPMMSDAKALALRGVTRRLESLMNSDAPESIHAKMELEDILAKLTISDIVRIPFLLELIQTKEDLIP